MIDRRTFLLVTTAVARLTAWSTAPTEKLAESPVTFVIEGWDLDNTAAADQVSIQINQSWRANWR